METTNDFITIPIQYSTIKTYCSCCDRKLDEIEQSEVREFNLSKKNILESKNYWSEMVEYEDDLQVIVRDYVYDTIHFFAASSSESLAIDKDEIDKVKQFILDNFKK